MAPSLPYSLSPHVCILCSPDLEDLFSSTGLPPLSQVLESFTPLPQVTTRTTSLTSVPHSSFALRFSDLLETENAIHEDDEQRAARMMDWIAGRISARSARWVEVMESQAADGKENMWRDRTPWWEEVKRCVEGDYVPNAMEGWNHPVAVIVAVSTNAPNPLHALQELHARTLDFPPWVDVTHLRYSLIVHPSNSALTDPIAEALFNAVKKQYGLHSYLLPLELPTSPVPDPVPVPPLTPRLPPPETLASPPLEPRTPTPNLVAPPTPTPSMSPMPRSPRPSHLMVDQQQGGPVPTAVNTSTLRLCEGDIQQTARFVREFVVQSLVPWMERCVIEWNETYSSSRRLPSRLFSSTRRLFGSSAPSAAPPSPVHGPNTSVSSTSSRLTHGPNSSVSSVASTNSLSTLVGAGVTQQRRLAEFATMLGDYKLAITVWEALRKESKGGSDVLPLLVTPSPALALHASNALSTLRSNAQNWSAPASTQLRALAYAVRWDIGIGKGDFLGPVLEGERWLVQAAGSAEESPAALLLSHAAFLSERKGRRRRSALWYMFAADRLEKGGIKPLAMHFFRKSHQLYKMPSVSELSPSFWESEDRDPADWRGFDAVLPGIEHELGRLMYTTGDTGGAVRYFLGLLRWCSLYHSPMLPPAGANGAATSEPKQSSTEKVYLEDFRVACKHFMTTERERWEAAELQLPLKLCQAKQTRIRFPGDAIVGDAAEWDRREETWSAFWVPRGKERLEKSGKAAVGETFWVDLVLHNPLNVEVSLSGLSVIVQELGTDADAGPDLVEIEVVDDITLEAKDTRTIPVSVTCRRPASLVITHVVFRFLDILPAKESLAPRGRRLHDTPQQRQSKTYAPDVSIRVEVEEAGQRLHANFVDDRHLVLAQGEYKPIVLSLTNTGTRNISEAWMVVGKDDIIWIDTRPEEDASISSASSPTEVLRSSNSLALEQPFLIPLERFHGASELKPGESMQIPAVLHAAYVSEQDLAVLFVFRETGAASFHCSRVTRHYEVRPIIEVAASSRPSRSSECSFMLGLEVENVTAYSDVRLTQVTTMSGIWSCSPLASGSVGYIAPQQVTRLALKAVHRQDGAEYQPTLDFVSSKLRDVLKGERTDPSEPPPIDLTCNHIAEGSAPRSVNDPQTRHFVHSSKRNSAARAAALAHPYIPPDTHAAVFPLHDPHAVDVLVFWALPAQGRAGHILLTGLALGARHAALRDVVAEAEGAKAKRSMYAETQRARAGILRAVRASEWNAEADPVVVSVQGATVRHDFAQGPCHAAVAFTVRNYSLTNSSKVTLRLGSTREEHSPAPSSALLPPQYAGRLTHRCTLAPLTAHTFHAKLWTSRSGSYALNGWTIETEIGERQSAGSETTAWRTRHRYIQGPPADDLQCVTIVDSAPLGL